MGVTGLWQLLDDGDSGEGAVKLSECSGQTWAVDLSSWIVHGRTGGQNTADVSPIFRMMKTVFARALCLLRNGILPVFVLDSLRAPTVKAQTLQDRCETVHGYSKFADAATYRSGLRDSNNLCKQLLEAMGLTVITSSGEAEKTCAHLNSRGLVDACLCEDGDAFLYGATTVYRHFDIKPETAKRYTLTKIAEKLKLQRGELVVLGMLSGSDYGDGVKGVGPKRVLELINKIHNYPSCGDATDVLTRILGWKENLELQALKKDKEKLSSMSKSTHCTKCNHPGRQPQHKKAGCGTCKTSADCGDSSIDCACEFHTLERKLEPYRCELDVRDKALMQPGFPFQQVVNEFLGETEAFTFDSVGATMPSWADLADALRMTREKVMEKMIPTMILIHLHRTRGWENFQTEPLRIIKECKRHFVACYQVQWQQFDFDKWTPQVSAQTMNETTPKKAENDSQQSDPYTVDVPCELLARRYQALVDKHKLQSSSKKKGPGKRAAPKPDPSQKTMADFSVKKKLTFSKGDASQN